MKRLLLALVVLPLLTVAVLAQDPTPTPSPVLSIVRDQAWQFGGFVVGTIALVISIIISLKSREKKELSYSVKVFSQLVGVGEGIKERVQITFDGLPVSGVYLFQATLRNTGKVPVVPTDYLEPITVKFDDKAQILSAHLYELNPSNLDVSIRMNEAENGIIFSPFLFNRGESIRFQILVDNPVVFRGFTQRIVGITEIRHKPMVVVFPGIKKWDWISGLLAFIGIAIIQLLEDTIVTFSTPVFVLLMAIGVGLLAVLFRLVFLMLKSAWTRPVLD